MIMVCAWCQRYLGSKEPLDDHDVSHGICEECRGRETRGDSSVLVVSRARTDTVPLLHTLLRAAPEISIVVDRRAGERRGNGKSEGRVHRAAAVPDRRAAERRRTPTFYLV